MLLKRVYAWIINVRCWTSLRIREMQIKSTMRSLFSMLVKTLIYEMAAVEAVWRPRYPATAGRTMKWNGYWKGQVARHVRNEDVHAFPP